MTALNATSKPSSSGARITGDDLQHLVVWYWCLRATADPYGITSVAVEADDAGNVDDVVVRFADGTSNFIQVKAAVASARLASDWAELSFPSAGDLGCPEGSRSKPQVATGLYPLRPVASGG